MRVPDRPGSRGGPGGRPRREQSARGIVYPAADRQPVVDDLHGHIVPDPYRWLEAPDSAATRGWLRAQRQLWLRHAAGLPGRERMRARVAELTDTGTVTAPMWRGDRRFFLRRSAGQEHAVLYAVGPDDAERVLVDPGRLDPDGTVTLDGWQPDWDGRLLAYQLSRRGDERARLYVADVATGRVVDGPLDRCRHSPVAWLAGRAGFFYVRTPPGGPADRREVVLHRLGAPPSEDVVILGAAADGGASYGLEISHDGRWLAISALRAGERGNDLWLADLDASAPEEPDLRVVQRGVDARTVIRVGGDGCLYIATDRGWPRGRLCVGDPARPRDGWADLVRADPGAVLGDFAILDGPELERPLLLVGWTRHAIGEISVHDLGSGEWRGHVPLPGAGSIGSLAARPTGGHEAWFTYMDSVSPAAVHRYDARTGETTLWAGAPGAAVVPDIDSRQIVCASTDGTPIRVVVVAQRAAGAGPRPTILYGYGGFGVPLTPTFSSYVLAWVEAGGAFAIAGLRGGGEEGEDWHRAGMLDRKQNVFDDFFAAAERLIADGWTTPGQLAVCGESNGGLLVGAAITQRPDLFAAAVCSAPLLDMVRYERSGLGGMWSGEYGAASDPEQLRWLLAYSPYHRVREGIDYPAVLFTVFERDSTVDPMHARKMCAALQAASAGERPILLREEEDVGHGERAVSRSVALAADMLAFLAAHTRLDLAPPGRAARGPLAAASDGGRS
jgi:prolyl oligopeptidase